MLFSLTPPVGNHFDVRERSFDGLDVAGAEEFGGENLRGVGAGFPRGDDLRSG